jgi:stage V sporulation protein G
MPSKKRKDGQFKDIAHPVNKETREEVERQIFAEYESQVKTMEQSLKKL